MASSPNFCMGEGRVLAGVINDPVLAMVLGSSRALSAYGYFSSI